jgi:GNAT superfamily N-acetyltransferase
MADCDFIIQPCKPAEAEQLAALVFQSEPILLSYLFGGEEHCLSFLRYACARADGQFSASRHWGVSDANNHESDVLLGACTTWYSPMSDVFQYQTLEALKGFFDVKQLGHLLVNREALDLCFTGPTKDQLCIGHLAIIPSARNLGLATSLIAFAKRKAQKMKKLALVLDVEKGNTAALNCYLNAGFNVVKENHFLPTEQCFLRLELPIQA